MEVAKVRTVALASCSSRARLSRILFAEALWISLLCRNQVKLLVMAACHN